MTANSSQVGNRDLWADFNENLRPEVLNKWLLEELVSYVYVVFSKDFREMIALSWTRQIWKERYLFASRARKQESHHLDYTFNVS